MTLITRVIVGNDMAQVGANGNVGSVDTPIEKSQLVVHATPNKLRCLWRDIDPYPLASQVLAAIHAVAQPQNGSSTIPS